MTAQPHDESPHKLAASAAASGVQALGQGFFTPLAGFTYMRRHSALWRYGVTPVLLNVLITGVLLVVLVVSVIVAAASLHGRFPEGWWGTLWEITAVVALVLVALAVTAAVWLLLQSVLCGYFYEKLARSVEVQLGVSPGELRDVPVSALTIDALQDFSVLLGMNAALLLLNCVPLLGSLIALWAALLLDALLFGGEYLGYPLMLRGMRRRQRREFVSRHRMHAVGLGAAVLLLNLIPLVGAVGLTTAVAGSVLLHRKLATETKT